MMHASIRSLCFTLFLGASALAAAPQDRPLEPITDKQALYDVFDIPRPQTSLDLDSGPPRPRMLSSPVRFRVPTSKALESAIRKGVGSVSFPEQRKRIGQRMEVNLCAIDILQTGGRVTGSSIEFEVDVATWELRITPPHTRVNNPDAPERVCGLFRAVDVEGIYRVACRISSCDATVADLRSFFGGGVELFEVGEEPQREPASGSAVVGDPVTFESTAHAPAPAPAPPKTPAPASAPAAPAPSAASASGTSASSPTITSGGATLLTR